MRRLEDDMRELEDENERLRDRLNKEAAKRHNDSQLLSEQQEHISKLEEALQLAQVAMFVNTARTGYACEEDSVIARDIGQLHKYIWRWAKANSRTARGDVNSIVTESPDALNVYLGEAGIDATLFPPCGHMVTRLLPALALTALVSCDIYTKLFDNPFFFLDSGAFTRSIQKGDALHDTLRLLNDCKPPSPPCFSCSRWLDHAALTLLP